MRPWERYALAWKAEAGRLRRLIRYALGAPTRDAERVVLLDALHGVTGADDCQRARATAAYRRDAARYGIGLGDGSGTEPDAAADPPAVKP